MGIAFAPSNSLPPEPAGVVPPDLGEPLSFDGARDFTAWLLGGICAIALAAALWLTRGANPLNLDTPSYLYFSPSRTIGYPAFLWLVKALAGHAAAAVPVQMALLAASLFLLGRSFHDLIGRRKLSLIFQLILVCSPSLWKSSAELMTEALATACVALWCAQLLQQLKQGSSAGQLRLALISAAGTLVRPSLLVLFAGSAVAALLITGTRQRRRGLLSLIPISVATLTLTPVSLLFINGSAATTSPLARGVLQHTLFCSGASVSGDADAALVEQDSLATRRYIAAAPEDIRIGLEHLYSAPLRFELIIPSVGRLHGFSAGWQTDPILHRVAQQRIKANPMCYARDVLTAYWQLVTQDSLHVGAPGHHVDDFLASHPPVSIATQPMLPLDQQALDRAAADLQVSAPVQRTAIGRFAAKSSPALLLLGRLLYGSTAAIGIASIAILALKRRPWALSQQRVIALAALGISLHTLFAGTAIVELGLIRYTLPAWPLVCTILAIASVALQDRNQSSKTSSILGTPATHQIAPNAATPAVTAKAVS